jgi:hypothetical protein
VDRNPVAVDLAKVSLWLATLAKDHAPTFLDQALRHGDSLVGLSRKQIEAFHWAPDAPRFQVAFETLQAREHVLKVAELRRRVREADETMSEYELRDLWGATQLELRNVRLLGDLLLAAFFDHDKTKDRDAIRSEYAKAVVGGEVERYRGRIEQRRHAEQALVPFHWEIEFPELFERDNPGFDAFVGNPPFVGVVILASSLGVTYTDWLRESNPGVGGKCDVVAFFFRRVFGLLRFSGCAGHLATKTIAQGDTRRSGLLQIIRSGGVIYSARRRIVWPGRASVIVSAIHFIQPANVFLDERSVFRICPFLLPSRVYEDPKALNVGIAYLGVKPGSRAFIFENTSASVFKRTDLDEFLRAHPEEASAIVPYVGGLELYGRPVPEPARRILRIGLLEWEKASKFPAALALLRRGLPKSRESIMSNEARLNDLRHLLIADFSSSTKSPA